MVTFALPWPSSSSSEVGATSAFDEHVGEHLAAHDREIIVVGDVAQALRGGVGAVLFSHGVRANALPGSVLAFLSIPHNSWTLSLDFIG